jgi:hypothetical protein
MKNLQGIFGLFIVLAITLTMGLQFSNFTEGFDNKGKEDRKDKEDKKNKNKPNNQDLPIHTKKSGSMAKQGVFDDMMPSY